MNFKRRGLKQPSSKQKTPPKKRNWEKKIGKVQRGSFR
jgi:hypothetical protein